MGKREVRNTNSQLEIRASEGKKNVIGGIAAVVNSVTDLGYFKEKIAPGAFDDCLSNDIRCLFNHDEKLILARTKSKTLKVWVDTSTGNLMYEFEVPKRSYAIDLLDSVTSGDIDQSSFAFTVKKESFIFGENGELDTRIIEKIDKLYDVSPVTFPAYQDTEVGSRSIAEARNQNKKEDKKEEAAEEENKPAEITKEEQNLIEAKLKLVQLQL